jgi:hypothetical protein
MPTAIKVDTFPKPVKNVDSKYRELIDYTVALVTDEKRRAVEAFTEPVEAGTFLKVASAVRNAAKHVGARVQIVLKDDVMHVRYLGEFVAMSDEMKAQKDAARKANADKLAAAAQASAKGK